MDVTLRSSLWNALDLLVWSRGNFLGDITFDTPGIEPFSRSLWMNYFKKPMDSRPEYSSGIYDEIRTHFFKCQWYEVYDFLEFVLEQFSNRELNDLINAVLDEELSAYRYVNGVITEITDAQEIEMLEEALADSDFPGVSNHLQRALELMSDRKNPDYRNSIKESISAVESLCQAITGNPKATLGDALKVIERAGKLHPALKGAFSQLYGFTSDEGGIRHAMLEEPKLSSADARFFLMACTAFANYLKASL